MRYVNLNGCADTFSTSLVVAGVSTGAVADVVSVCAAYGEFFRYVICSIIWNRKLFVGFWIKTIQHQTRVIKQLRPLSTILLVSFKLASHLLDSVGCRFKRQFNSYQCV